MLRPLPIVVPAAVALLLIQAPNQAQTPSGVSVVRTFTHPRLDITVVATQIALPAGEWSVAAVTPATALEQLFLVAQLSPDDMPGRRTLTAHLREMTESGQWRLQPLFGPLAQYAKTHGGVGPKSLTELDRKQYGTMIDALTRSPWPEDELKPATGPYVFLAPATPLVLDASARPSTPAVPLVVELRPYVDDGRHWVLFSNGVTQRVAIDRAWVAKHKLTIRPVRASAVPAAAAPATVPHTLLALRRAPAAAATVTLVDASSGTRRDVTWSLTGGTSDPMVVSEWAMARAAGWLPYVNQGHAPILQAWISRASALYGASPAAGRDQFGMMAESMPFGREPRVTSVFDLLGGRAALRETLQLELLRGAADGPSPFAAAAASISIGTLKGVDVTALPFDRMLAGRAGGELALANRVPDDRLFVYFAKPSALFPFLSEGGDFLARAGSTMTATAFDDHLKARYLRRLGLPEASSRKFLESGAVSEVALVAPDLFFLEGTDVTVVMRVRAPDATMATLALLAGIDVPNGKVVERPTPSGRPAYWARLGDLVFVGTSALELDRMLTLPAAASLGRSAELRYMLSEVPVRAETRALVYLSDPFIRRLVGPAVKIGQLRRMRAAADMTLITAGAMLRALDGHDERTDVATLVKLGYVPRGISTTEYTLQPDRSVVSRTWGTLADLNAIDTGAIRTVTAQEAEAYTQYLQEYKEYWRQFFDPIAMRLDDAPGGALEMTTFILPLVDSQLYTQLRGVLETHEKKTTLRVPRLAPEPVLQMSLNLSDESWVAISSGWSEMFSQYTGINPEIFDLMGSGLHIAVQDADPVISLGTSDLLGAFGGASMGARLDILTPFALSLLTRPCKIFIELEDAPRALGILRRATRSAPRFGPGLPVVFRQIEGRDAWMYTIGVPGIAVLRLGLEIQNGYLVLSNIPWSDAMRITSVEPRPLNGAAIQVTPDSVRQGLAALFATQAEHDQMAALASMGSLLPFLQTLAAAPDDAASRHAALFGATPLHPGSGAWLWRDGQLESSRFGSGTRWKVPAFKPESGDFGLFRGATVLDMNMQFEQGGLRAIARWKLTPTAR